MPELPEVETVKETLKRKVLNKTITEVTVLYEGIIESPSVLDFANKIQGQTIKDITRLGKWLIFHLDDYFLLSHLRMEGKYFLKNTNEDYTKHEHVIFKFSDNTDLRYQDTRKFGKMLLVDKDKLNEARPIKELGLEPWSNLLTKEYLKLKYKTKRLPIKTVILDQSIITGIGNIYADEILFLSRINPLTKVNLLRNKDLDNIIDNTRKVLEKAIKEGGTTIRSYTSDEGVTGRFQNELYVHCRENESCLICGSKILKTRVGGRGTYYCPKCQK
ncbi:MAG: DNA-formamidopyrimidine glycosylase [Bacilli bacterium]|nr:DNA-formamidopyrimidine glycosylase [Bacilli bacterium]